MYLLLAEVVSSHHVLIKFFVKQNCVLNETQGGIPWIILTTQKIDARASLINRK